MGTGLGSGCWGQMGLWGPCRAKCRCLHFQAPALCAPQEGPCPFSQADDVPVCRLRDTPVAPPSHRGQSQGPCPWFCSVYFGGQDCEVLLHWSPPPGGRGPEPVSLPAGALKRMGRRRPPQGHGRHTTASTGSTCPACTAVAAAMAVRPASRPRPTLSATPRSPSTCELGCEPSPGGQVRPWLAAERWRAGAGAGGPRQEGAARQ